MPQTSEDFNIFDEPSGNDPSCDDLSSESDAPNSAVQDQDNLQA